MSGVTFIESYIEDGAIFVSVEINGKPLPQSLMMDLDDWSYLRASSQENTNPWITVLTKSERDAECLPPALA